MLAAGSLLPSAGLRGCGTGTLGSGQPRGGARRCCERCGLLRHATQVSSVQGKEHPSSAPGGAARPSPGRLPCAETPKGCTNPAGGNRPACGQTRASCRDRWLCSSLKMLGDRAVPPAAFQTAGDGWRPSFFPPKPVCAQKRKRKAEGHFPGM